MKRSTYAALAISAAALPAIAPAQIRIVTYNTETAFNTNGNPNAGLQTVLQGIGNENVGGIGKRIDILTLQEQNNTTGTTTSQILTMMSNLYGAGVYAKGTAISGATNSPNTDSSAVIYDTTKFQLVNEVLIGTPSTSGMPRQEIRYQFRPVGYGANSDFYVYVGHWKALGDATSMMRRNVEAQVLRAEANAQPAGSRILYVGDMNITGGVAETAWATITAPGNGQGIDPKGGSWAQGNMTWSTSNLGSRLDFQLNTPPTMDGRGFSLINGSYHTFGNNGSTPLGGAANSGSNTALPGLPNRSAVLSGLVSASDHYPVVGDYRYPAKMGASVAAVPGVVIVGASVPVNVTVTNTAPVTVAAGADGLDYTFAGSGAVTGSGGASMLMALSPGNVHALSLNTNTPGVASGSVDVTGTSQEVANGTFSQPVSTTVLAHANPSFDGGADVDGLTIEFGIRARGSGFINQPAAVHNLAHPSGFTAMLDVDQVNSSGSTAQLSANVATFSNLDPGDSAGFSATLDTSAVGLFNTQYTLLTSDEDLPGSTSLESLVLTLNARVAIGGDATLDNLVNLADYNVLAGNFGQSNRTWQTGDFTSDGLVNLTDYNILAGNYGLSAGPNGPTPEDWAALMAVVPEPGFTLPVVFGAFALVRRTRQITK